jgi:hypothetical protein
VLQLADELNDERSKALRQLGEDYKKRAIKAELRSAESDPASD